MRSWLQNHPALLEGAYQIVEAVLRFAQPLIRGVGYGYLEGIFEVGERVTKGPLFDCRMCGMCNLRGTGMTCPMTCPKHLRNGPCGGVRQNGKCEVEPEMDCIWLQGWERSKKMAVYGDLFLDYHPPVDYRLEGTSAWLNAMKEWDDAAAERRSPGR